MSKLPVKNMQGESQGEFDLPDDLLVFDKGQQAVKDSVVAYRNNMRAGTASTLTKSEVAGTGRKPWKQKGTGNARVGTRRSPVWRGGGTVFGPKPRSYNQKMTKKAARLAFRRAMSEKIAAGQMLVVDELAMDAPKTKQFNEMLKNLEVKGNILVVLDTLEANVALSARNLTKVEVALAKDVNTYQLLRSPTVVVTRPGMETLQARLVKAAKGKNGNENS